MVFYCQAFPELFHYFTEYIYTTYTLHFYLISHFAIIPLIGNYEKLIMIYKEFLYLTIRNHK